MALQSSARVLRAESGKGNEAARLSGLGNRFVELFGHKLSQQAFASEMAKLIADVVRLKAVAILGYDRRRERLTLLADEGLRDDARAALGAGAECTWDIPLRGLRNRRISVIEAAHQNPFVPRPLVNLSPTSLSVASLPIYYDYEPTGVVLLFAAGSRGFTDAVLQTLSQAVRVCARGLRTTDVPAARAGGLSRGEGETGAAESGLDDAAREGPSGWRRDEQEAAQQTLRVVESAGARPGSAEQLPTGPTERERQLEQELTQARAEVARANQAQQALTASANTVARERDGLIQQLADAERLHSVEVAELRAQIDALEERLLAAESDRSRYQRAIGTRYTAAQQSIAALESERDTLRQRAHEFESRTADLQTTLAATQREREQLATQVETLTAQVQATQDALKRVQSEHAEERSVLEADRTGWKDETSALRAELAQRTESLLALERDLRGAVVARDAATTQLQATRDELNRLSALTDELEQARTQLEAARASAAAEGAALRRALDEERTSRLQTEETLRTSLSTSQAQAESLSSEGTALRGELAATVQGLAERNDQLAQLRQQQEAARQAEVSRDQANAALRAELATLSARLEQNNSERQQLLEERVGLRAALTEERRKASEGDIAHAAALGQLEAEANELHRQIELATAERAGLAGRYERAAEDGRGLTRGLTEARRRVEELTGLLQQRDAALNTLGIEREQQAAQVALLTGQLRAGAEALERAQARAAQERTTIEADRDGWKEQVAVLRGELAQRTEAAAVRERDAQAVAVARDALAGELQATRVEVDRLTALAEQLRHTATELEAARDGATADNVALRRALEDERATRVSSEQVLRASLAAAQTQAEQQGATVVLLHSEVAERTRTGAERDERLATLRSEIEALRQQSADRGVLAQQAGELGGKVVELEQQLAATRGEVARAERQRDAMAEALEAARRRETDIAAEARRDRAALQEALERLTTEHSRLETGNAAQAGEIEGLRNAVAGLQTTLRQVKAERESADAAQDDVERDFAETQRRLDEVNQVLRQRDAAVGAAAAERQQLTADLAAARQELHESREALQAARARAAEEFAAMAAERTAWKDQATAAYADRDRLTTAGRELEQRVAQLEAARSAAVDQCAVLRHASEEEQARGRSALEGARAEASALQSDIATLRAESDELHAEIAVRETEIADLRRSEEAARQAEMASEQTSAALRAEVARLSARLEESAAEGQALRAGRTAVERQLALVAATHGEEEQALAQALQAAREQVAQLEEERRSLHATLGETRQRVQQADTAHAAALKQQHADAAELRKQVKALTAARAKLTDRLERSEQARDAQAAQLQQERQRAASLTQQRERLEQSLAAAEARQAELGDALVQARTGAETLTARLEESVADGQRLQEAGATAERQLALLLASRDTEAETHAQALQVQQEQVAQLGQEGAALRDALAQAQQQAEGTASALAQVQETAAKLQQQAEELTAERARLKQQLERIEQARAAEAERVEAEENRATTLADQCTRLEQSLQAGEARRTTLDAELARARSEIEALQQQSADRGVLAHQAAELGSKVVDLEQQLAVVRGEAARAERQRAAVTEELEAARHQHSEIATAAAQDQTALRDALAQVSAERNRLAAERLADAAQAETQQATVAELRESIEHLRTERTRAEAQAHDVSQRLAETHQRMDGLSTLLRQRDAALESAASERHALMAQVNKLTAQLRATDERLESTQGRDALERAAIEADRDAWQERTAAALAEIERLGVVAEELIRKVTALETARDAAAGEGATQRRTFEDERAARVQIEQALRADLATAQTELERLSSAATTLQDALAERDARLGALLQERESVRQAEAGWQQANAGLRAEITTLAARLDETTAECQRLHDQRETVERQLALLVATRGEEAEALTQGLQAAREQIAQLEQERAALRSGLTETRQRLAQAETAQAAVLTELRTEAARSQQHLQTLAADHAALGERLREAEQTNTAATTRVEEETRRAAALSEQCATLQRSLAEVQAHRATLDDELIQARAQIDALRQESADRGALAQQASTLANTVTALEQQLTAARGDGERAQRERTRLAEQLEAARREREQALAAAAQELATREESRRRLTAERDGLEADAETLRTHLQTQQEMLAQVQADLEQAQAERAVAEEQQQAIARRLTEAERRLPELEETLRQRESATEAALAERHRMEEAIQRAEASAAALTAERDALQREIAEVSQRRLERGVRVDALNGASEAFRPDEAPRPRGGESTAMPDPADETVARSSGRLIIERSAPLGAVVEGPAEPPEGEAEPVHPEAPAVPTGDLVLLDEGSLRDDACAALTGAGFQVTAFPPTEAGVNEVARRKVKCVMLNLASGPGAWRTLRTLRERVGTRSIPILAYLMSANAPTGFCFGRAEFVLWPLESSRVIERLRHLRPKLRRLLVLSADVDGMGQMRDALVQTNISTSIVLDGKQALELTAMVEPEAAILHLAPACPSVARALLGLRAADLTRDLPIMVLLDKAPAAREEAFFTATTLQLLGKTPFQFSNLPEEIARLVG